ncbi:MAG TPA: hypothetical protein ENN43_06575, partial [bacterium]|nr:hypothetical protein [bacterium]
MMKKNVLLIILMMAAAAAAFAAQEEYVNLSYLGEEIKASWVFVPETTEIRITGNGGRITILLNYPFVIKDGNVYRVDTPPFAEKGHIFISGETYRLIAALFDGKPAAIQTAAAEVEKAAGVRIVEEPVKRADVVPAKPEPARAAATAVPTVVPTAVPVKAAEKEASPQPVAGKKRDYRIIVIDPGHGGNDPGAVGKSGLLEKEVVLDVALKVRDYLKKEKNVKVLITREADKYVTLKDRAAFANREDADLFVSIHCNASTNRAARGTRTY